MYQKEVQNVFLNVQVWFMVFNATFNNFSYIVAVSLIGGGLNVQSWNMFGCLIIKEKVEF